MKPHVPPRVHPSPRLVVAGFLAVALSFAPARATPAAAQSGQVRIVQTNSAGDNVHIIDPVTNEVVQIIEGIPKAHGVAAQPDGSVLYFSNEVHRTLEIVPTDVMTVTERIPLSGRPHNVAISNDGRRVYVAIIQDCSCVDVVDLDKGEVVKSIPTLGTVHNVFMSPDGRHVAAGMIGARTLTIIDTSIDEAIWSLHFSGRTTGGYADGGVRPMAFETHADGSTKRLFIQISNYHGVYVVDFAQRKVVRKLDMPSLPISRVSPTTRFRDRRATASRCRRAGASSGRRASPTATSTHGPCRISNTLGASRSATSPTGSR